MLEERLAELDITIAQLRSTGGVGGDLGNAVEIQRATLLDQAMANMTYERARRLAANGSAPADWRLMMHAKFEERNQVDPRDVLNRPVEPQPRLDTQLVHPERQRADSSTPGEPEPEPQLGSEPQPEPHLGSEPQPELQLEPRSAESAGE